LYEFYDDLTNFDCVNKYIAYSIVALSRVASDDTSFKLHWAIVFQVVCNNLRDSPITITNLHEIIMTIYRHQRMSVTWNVITPNISKIRLNPCQWIYLIGRVGDTIAFWIVWVIWFCKPFSLIQRFLDCIFNRIAPVLILTLES